MYVCCTLLLYGCARDLDVGRCNKETSSVRKVIFHLIITHGLGYRRKKKTQI